MQQRCCLLESAIEAGEGQWLIRAMVEFMGCCQLHAVVAAQSENIGESPSCFNQPLADLDDDELIPAKDQALTGLLDVIPADRIFSLTTGHTRHGLCPGDPADRDGFCLRAALLHLIGVWLTDQQLDQGTGIAEQDHQLNPDLPSRFH